MSPRLRNGKLRPLSAHCVFVQRKMSKGPNPDAAKERIICLASAGTSDLLFIMTVTSGCNSWLCSCTWVSDDLTCQRLVSSSSFTRMLTENGEAERWSGEAERYRWELLLPLESGTVIVENFRYPKAERYRWKKTHRPKAERYRWDFLLAAVSRSASVEYSLFAAPPFSYRLCGDANNGQ